MGFHDFDLLLGRAAERRSGLFGSTSTDCFRLFNGEGDGCGGLALDIYGEWLLIQYFDDSIYNSLGAVCKAVSSLAASLPAGIRGILAKDRRFAEDSSDKNELWRSRIIEGIYDEAGITVHQNGILAQVDLLNGQNTGIFLDMREVREKLGGFYPGSGIKSMINLFSYTGLFSLHALKNGVERAVNVDLSKGVLRRARENYELNGLAVDDRDFIYGDSMEWIKIFTRKRTLFDYAVFDPPTFARNRRRNFSVRRNYSESLKKLEAVVPCGYLLTSVNSYSVSREEYISYHPAGWELLMFSNESSDFVNRGEPYLKAGLWKI